MSKPILITGATGKQGGSVLRALLSHPKYNPNTYPIYALTRNPTSPSSEKLKSLSSSVSLIKGDLNDVPAIFSSLPQKPWGVFSVQLPGKTEVSQGKALVDAAVAADVSHFVYTSVDRHGEQATDVPHFASKHEIEQYLVQKAEESNGKLTYTILRPVFFLENLEWGYIGKIIATAWRDHVGGKKLSVIATADIGSFGANAFLESDSPTYKTQKISLAGDDLTFEEADKVFVEKTGEHIPVTFGFVASLMLWAVKDLNLMFRFFRNEGYSVDIQGLRKIDGGLKDLRTWIDTSSYGKKKK